MILLLLACGHREASIPTTPSPLPDLAAPPPLPDLPGPDPGEIVRKGIEDRYTWASSQFEPTAPPFQPRARPGR